MGEKVLRNAILERIMVSLKYFLFGMMRRPVRDAKGIVGDGGIGGGIGIGAGIGIGIGAGIRMGIGAGDGTTGGLGMVTGSFGGVGRLCAMLGNGIGVSHGCMKSGTWGIGKGSIGMGADRVEGERCNLALICQRDSNEESRRQVSKASSKMQWNWGDTRPV